MDERTFNAQCAILDGLKMYDNKSYKVPITSELLRLAQNAHRSYQIYLEYQKRKEKEMEKQKEKDEKILAKEREIAENWKKEVTTIKCLKNDLKFAEHECKEASKDAQDMTLVLKQASKNKKIQAHTLEQLVKAFEEVREVEKSKLNNVTKLQ